MEAEVCAPSVSDLCWASLAISASSSAISEYAAQMQGFCAPCVTLASSCRAAAPSPRLR